MISTVIDTHTPSMIRLTQTLRDAVKGIHIFPFGSAELMIDSMTHVEVSPNLAIINVNPVICEQDLPFCQSITAYWPDCKIIIFYRQRSTVVPFLRLGAHGFLKKGAEATEVRECIEWVLSGRRYCNTDFINWIIGTSPKRLSVRR